jgi:hypothetical protein
MRITTQVSYLWSDRQNRYILLSRKWTNISGPVALCKGASQQQEDLANSQQKFYDTMTSDYSKQFENQNAILGTLRSSLNPIIAAGPGQFGYTPGEVNALNSQAIQGTGQQYANLKKALSENQAAAGGGDVLLPSGVAAQQQATLGSTAANQASSQLLGIQQAGYDRGYQTYESALGQLGGVAGMYNPNGVATGANTAGSAAATTANQVTQLNNAASPWNLVGGIIGGGLSAFTGGLGSSLGGGLGKALGGTTSTK